MMEHLKEMWRRERDWLEWAGKHDGEREAQLAALAEVEPLYFWALEHALNKKPKWVLRKGEWLDADSARTLGENELRVEEPLPMYRAFKPFVGDASAAAARAYKNWEKRGRAALEAELAACARRGVPVHGQLPAAVGRRGDGRERRGGDRARGVGRLLLRWRGRPRATRASRAAREAGRAEGHARRVRR